MMKRILLKLLLPLAVASTYSQAAPELIPLYPDAVMKASLYKIPPFAKNESGGP